MCTVRLGLVDGNFTTVNFGGNGERGGVLVDGNVGIEPRELYFTGGFVKDWEGGKQRGKARVKLGTRGTEVSVSGRREIGQFANVGVGVKCSLETGVYCIFKVGR